MIFVTGGAGFIGSNFVLDWLARTDEPILNLDKLTYAGNRENLASLHNDGRHIFVHGDICDADLIGNLLARHRPRAIVHFAAESHVDRSIHDPQPFITTNINGTANLLAAATEYWRNAQSEEKAAFRFLHASTDEVFGSLEADDKPFTEFTRYAPNSPYSASKAASDHLVRAYHHTYGLPTLTTNCTNNYGPFQFPEKLIPLMIANAVRERPLPVYGDGRNVRDWIYVADNCSAMRHVLESGRPGETYNIGSETQRSNMEVVHAICKVLDERRPRRIGRYADLIAFVSDRRGHDRRYAIDAGKIRRELGWRPLHDFDDGIRLTVNWFLDRPSWLEKAVAIDNATPSTGHCAT